MLQKPFLEFWKILIEGAWPRVVWHNRMISAVVLNIQTGKNFVMLVTQNLVTEFKTVTNIWNVLFTHYVINIPRQYRCTDFELLK